MVDDGALTKVYHANAPWFHLSDAPAKAVKTRLDAQLSIYAAIIHGAFSTRMGQTLEIATYKALCRHDGTEFFGRYKDLDAHDDSSLYSKEEPPQHIGKLSLSGNERLDFIVRHESAGHLGIECKNVREWLYPDRAEIKEALVKCVLLDCVPVLVARRIPYVSFLILSQCGVIMHEMFNQLFPLADTDLAARAKHKDFLGYHDIREGNEPDKRLVKFITQNLPKVAPEARAKFSDYKDLLIAFGTNEMEYAEFAARVRRRSNGTNEGGDWEKDKEG
jgi:hypothetical protein